MSPGQKVLFEPPLKTFGFKDEYPRRTLMEFSEGIFVKQVGTVQRFRADVEGKIYIFLYYPNLDRGRQCIAA